MSIDGALHQKARNTKPELYPDRFPVPDEYVNWAIPYPEYKPPYFVAPTVLENDNATKSGGWADSEKFDAPKKTLVSHEGNVVFDEEGRPRNPAGRTGISGRGLLGKWGANFAADPIITRTSSKTGKIEMLAIRRKDNGQWAIPGGMVDAGEKITKTLTRELEEETGIHLDWDNAQKVYQGYGDDPRNTDNAWIEVDVAHLHLEPSIADALKPNAGDDAAAVCWQEITDEFLDSMYGAHGMFLRLALSQQPD